MPTRRVALMVAAVLALALTTAAPSFADDDRHERGWRSAARGPRVHDRGRHRDHRDEVVRQRGGHAGGTTGPYWGTMRPYWGNMAPSTVTRGTGRRHCD